MEHVSIDMRSIAIKSRHEAVIVRIITVITLIFLPGTFVSVSPYRCRLNHIVTLTDLKKTFFSTDVIKYEGSSSAYSSTAMYRWLQVTMVLTAITMAIAGVLFLQSRRTRRQEMSELPRHHMKLEEV